MIYAGIGSRKTPLDVCDKMTEWAAWLGSHGHTLRSGGAIRADQSFERGCNAVNGRKEIYTASMVAPNSPWITHASIFHPAWHKCDVIAQALHARNSAIVLGPFLNVPVDFILCWTENGKAMGGTGQALRIATKRHDPIPIFNFYHRDCEERLREFLS